MFLKSVNSSHIVYVGYDDRDGAMQVVVIMMVITPTLETGINPLGNRNYSNSIY